MKKAVTDLPGVSRCTGDERLCWFVSIDFDPPRTDLGKIVRAALGVELPTEKGKTPSAILLVHAHVKPDQLRQMEQALRESETQG